MKGLTVVLTYLAVTARAFYSIFDHNGSMNDKAGPASQRIGRRWTDTLAWEMNDDCKPWPKDPYMNFAVVRYCFSDHDTWSNMNDIVQAAANLWISKMQAPNKESGHALWVDVAPHMGTDAAPFCWTTQPSTASAHDGVWNNVVNQATVAIHTHWTGRTVPGAKATRGYSPKNANWNNMILDYPPGITSYPQLVQMMIPMVAHEFGHVFGMLHEHQRPDRDRYVHFDCSQVNGYINALNAIQQKTASGQQPHSILDICDDASLAIEQYNFPAILAYCKDDYVVYGETFDDQSIMLYSSEAFGMPNKDMRNIFQVPLVKWKRAYTPSEPLPPARNSTNCEILSQTIKVSDGDLAGIKYMYPWEEQP